MPRPRARMLVVYFAVAWFVSGSAVEFLWSGWADDPRPAPLPDATWGALFYAAVLACIAPWFRCDPLRAWRDRVHDEAANRWAVGAAIALFGISLGC